MTGRPGKRVFERSQSYERTNVCENLHFSVAELGMAGDEKRRTGGSVVKRHPLLSMTI